MNLIIDAIAQHAPHVYCSVIKEEILRAQELGIPVIDKEME